MAEPEPTKGALSRLNDAHKTSESRIEELERDLITMDLDDNEVVDMHRELREIK